MLYVYTKLCAKEHYSANEHLGENYGLKNNTFISWETNCQRISRKQKY